MTHPDIDYMYVMERRRDELAEAAQSRLFKEARATLRASAEIPPRSRFARRYSRRYSRLSGALSLGLARLLSWAGERMLAWSCHLQYRGALIAEKAAELQLAAELQTAPEVPSAPCVS